MFSGRAVAFFKIAFLFLTQNSLTYLFGSDAPPLLLIGVLVYSLKEGPRFGLAIGLFAGLFGELFCQGGLGLGLVSMAAAGSLSGFFSSKVFQEGTVTEIFFPLIAVYSLALAEIVTLQLSSGASFEWAWLGLAFRPWMMAGTIAASPLVFSFIQKRSGRRRGLYTI